MPRARANSPSRSGAVVTPDARRLDLARSDAAAARARAAPLDAPRVDRRRRARSRSPTTAGATLPGTSRSRTCDAARRSARGRSATSSRARSAGARAVVLKEGSAFRGGARFVEAEGRIWRRARGWSGGAKFLGVAGANAYLVFEDEGRDTLEGALGGGGLGGVFGGGRDGAAFAEALGCATEAQACKKVSRELLKCVKGLHDKKIIHRDVKPNNVLLTKKGLRLIDLGGAADLKTGQNYDEAETVFDPVYGPPERYLTGKFGGGGGAGEWNKNKPDLFDAFSVGMVILQVSVPAFRKKNGMKGVRGELKTWAYDCEAWRASLPERRQSDFAILDENDGAGWKLVCGLVANRSQRISVSKALSSSFCR